MAETIELMSIKEICSTLKISRNTFYRNYKDRIIQIPTTSKELKFEKKSVLELHSILQQNKDLKKPK